MTITSLMDDYCPRRGFRGEHGLSLYIETDSAAVLLDTGQDGAFLDNAKALPVDLHKLDAIVLSHGHYDHGGGLAALYGFLGSAPLPLFVGAGFDATRLVQRDGATIDIGLDPSSIPSGAVVTVSPPSVQEIAKGVYVLTRAERFDGMEPSPQFRKLVQGHETVDDFNDELSIVVDSGDALVVITGCAHRGILNIVQDAQRRFPGKPIKAIVGGFHLVDTPDGDISQVAEAVAALNPKAVYCGHCTGPRGFASLSDALPGKVTWLSCGSRISL